VQSVYQLPETSPCLRIMMQMKAKAAAATGTPLDTSAAAYTHTGLRSSGSVNKHAVSGLQTGMRNFSLNMGRSFRVGWSKDGKIVHAGQAVFSSSCTANNARANRHSVLVELVDTLRWGSSTAAQALGGSGASGSYSDRRTPQHLIEAPMAALLEGAHRVQQNRSAEALTESEQAAAKTAVPSLPHLPLWCLPQANPAELHEYVPFLKMLKATIGAYNAHAPGPQFPDWTVGKALELIDATYGQEKTVFSPDEAVRAVELLPLYEDRQQYLPEVWERRRSLLSAWIESVAVTEG
jgi:hypothetical protein